MGLFKSKDERRVEREMKIRSGMRAIEKSVRQQEKFAEDFIKNAQHARKIGDEQQYQFIRGAPEEDGRRQEDAGAAAARDEERDVDPAAGAGQAQFAESMNLMAREIGRVLAKTVNEGTVKKRIARRPGTDPRAGSGPCLLGSSRSGHPPRTRSLGPGEPAALPAGVPRFQTQEDRRERLRIPASPPR